MHGRNGSLLAFRPARAPSDPDTTSRAPSTNGAGSASEDPGGSRSEAAVAAPLEVAATEAAVVSRAHLDCPRCRLPITVESLHWQPAKGVEAPQPEDAEGRLVADSYAAIRDGERQYRAVIHDLERRLLDAALEESDGVMKEAAEILGIKYTTFVAKAHRLGLTPEED